MKVGSKVLLVEIKIFIFISLRDKNLLKNSKIMEK